MVDEYEVVVGDQRLILFIRSDLSVCGVLSETAENQYSYRHTFPLMASCGLSPEAHIALKMQGFYFEQDPWQTPADDDGLGLSQVWRV